MKSFPLRKWEESTPNWDPKAESKSLLTTVGRQDPAAQVVADQGALVEDREVQETRADSETCAALEAQVSGPCPRVLAAVRAGVALVAVAPAEVWGLPASPPTQGSP